VKVLVTGAFGNVGRGAVRALADQGHDVRCLDLPAKHKRPDGLQVAWGDVRDPDTVDAAVQGQDVVVHLAFVLPPRVDADPATARAVNIDGTRNVLAATERHSARILFASTFDVYGRTQHLDPPRKVTDLVEATDEYSTHKIACEQMVRESSVPWSIYRFADVPPKQRRTPVPLMFEIPLDNRFEVVHVDDVGLAIANGVSGAPIWGRTWLIGGGETCQIRYRDLLSRSLEPLGLGPLPDKAFTTTAYCTDWLDSTESQEVLKYQTHTFDDIMAYVTHFSRPPLPRLLVPLIRPLVRRSLLRLSPYL
jgi:nucleoside-diphosphate-sugar epimerase